MRQKERKRNEWGGELGKFVDDVRLWRAADTCCILGLHANALVRCERNAVQAISADLRWHSRDTLPRERSPGIDGDGAQKRAVQGGGELAAAAALEYVRDCAAAARVARHVLDKPYDWDAELHAEGVLLAHVVERDALRRGDEQRAVQRQARQALDHAGRQVSGARRWWRADASRS
jgi:hypothetical protein